MSEGGYIPPALRHNANYKPKKLSLKQKPIHVDYSKLETKSEIFEKYRKVNIGKADEAWNEN